MSDSTSPIFVTGQRVTLAITDIAFGGEGVGRVGQFVVFVPFVVLSEEVEAELTESRNSLPGPGWSACSSLHRCA